MHILVTVYFVTTVLAMLLWYKRSKKYEKLFIEGKICEGVYEAETTPLMYFFAVLPLAGAIFSLMILMEPVGQYLFQCRMDHTKQLANKRQIYLEHKKYKAKILRQLDDELDQKLLKAGRSIKYQNRK